MKLYIPQHNLIIVSSGVSQSQVVMVHFVFYVSNLVIFELWCISVTGGLFLY